VPGLDGVYAIGDTAVTRDADGKPLPGLAQVAQQQGRHLGKALRAKIHDGKPIAAFRFHDRGNAGIIGRHAAFFDFKRWQLVGWPAWILWAIIHVWLLVGFEHRMMVCLQWLWLYLSYQSGARLIIHEPD
jgi:NADH dehydrogenase